MKVSELQEILKKYESNTELVVAIWDKECFKSMDTEARVLSDNEWNYVACNLSVQDHDQMFGAGIRRELEAEMKANDVKTEAFINKFAKDYESGLTEEQLWDTDTATKKGEQ